MSPKTSRPFVAPLLALLVFLSSSSVQAQIAWTLLDEGSQSSLARVDLSTAEATPLMSFGEVGSAALAEGVGTDLFLINRLPVPTLFRLETATLSLNEIGPLGLSPAASIIDITTDAAGRIFMSAQEFEQPPSLYSVDRLTGTAAPIGETALPLLALAADGERLLALGFNAAESVFGLFEVDPSDAGVIEVFEFPTAAIGFSAAMDLGSGGELLILSNLDPPVTPPQSAHLIHTIDLESGAIALIAEETGAIFQPYRGFVVSDGTEVVEVPALGSSLPIFITVLIAAGLAVIRVRQ